MHEIIEKYIDAFKPRLRCVIEVEARYIERYLLLIIQMFLRFISIRIVKYGMIFINQKIFITASLDGFFFCSPLYIYLIARKI